MSSISETAEKLLIGTKLPASPVVLRELLQTLDCDDESINVHSLIDLIETDPSITALVLRHANSAMFGRAAKVGSVHDALYLLGFNNIRSASIAASVVTRFPDLHGLNASAFIRSSDWSAHFCKEIAIAASVDVSHAWLAGFICRIGEVLFAQTNPTAIARIESTPLVPGYRWKRELHMFGCSEGNLVAHLVRGWNFPEPVVKALDECAIPIHDEWPFHFLSGIVHIGILLSDCMMMKYDEIRVAKILPRDVLDILCVDFGAVLRIYSESMSALEFS